jgi:PEP-CTERM motif
MKANLSKHLFLALPLLTASMASSAHAIVIDQFNTGVRSFSGSGGFAPGNSGNSYYGGSRFGAVVYNGAASGTGTNSFEIGNGMAHFSVNDGPATGATDTPEFGLVYGNPDEGAGPTVDWTQLGDSFSLNVLSLSHDVYFAVQVIGESSHGWTAPRLISASSTAFDLTENFSDLAGLDLAHSTGLVFAFVSRDGAPVDLKLASIQAAPVPEPAPLAFLTIGSFALFLRRKP